MVKTLANIGCILFVFMMAQTAKAETDTAGTLEPRIWHIDTVVTVRGIHLRGSNPSKSKLCFAPQSDKNILRCFSPDHPNIEFWTDSLIRFTPPKNTFPEGLLVISQPTSTTTCSIIFGSRSCSTSTSRENTVIESYVAHPYISSVTEQGSTKLVHDFKTETVYEITGFRFGDVVRGIYLGHRLMNLTDILAWSNDKILFSLSEEYDEKKHGSPEIRVYNGAAKSNPWNIIETTESPITAQVIPTQKQESLFPDVSAAHPYNPAIRWGVDSGFLQGYPDGTFRPDNPVTRAEFLKILLGGDARIETYKKQSSTPFNDVDPIAWYAAYVRFAKDVGVINGYPDGTFRPLQPVNTAEALKMAYRAFQVSTPDPLGTAWYARYLEHAKKNAMLFSNTLAPNDPMKRKDVVWMVWKILQWKK